jgi:hypothetical protein
MVLLGLLGVAPELLALVLALFQPTLSGFAQMAGLLYSTIIYSFLGGLWWMGALLAGRSEAWVYGLSAAPSLLSWSVLIGVLAQAVALPHGLLAIAVLVSSSPLIDHALAAAIRPPEGWLGLRWRMAAGLGLTTMAVAFAGGARG